MELGLPEPGVFDPPIEIGEVLDSSTEPDGQYASLELDIRNVQEINTRRDPEQKANYYSIYYSDGLGDCFVLDLVYNETDYCHGFNLDLYQLGATEEDEDVGLVSLYIGEKELDQFPKWFRNIINAINEQNSDPPEQPSPPSAS
jgi:hypothetical protein